MSHHSEDKPLGLPEGAREEIRKVMDPRRNQVAKEMRKQLEGALGPTGAFPDGQIAPHDEGELAFGITVSDGVVIIDFGKPVRSVGLQPDQACELGRLLITRAGRSCTIGFG